MVLFLFNRKDVDQYVKKIQMKRGKGVKNKKAKEKVPEVKPKQVSISAKFIGQVPLNQFTVLKVTAFSYH